MQDMDELANALQDLTDATEIMNREVQAIEQMAANSGNDQQFLGGAQAEGSDVREARLRNLPLQREEAKVDDIPASGGNSAPDDGGVREARLRNIQRQREEAKVPEVDADGVRRAIPQQVQQLLGGDDENEAGSSLVSQSEQNQILSQAPANSSGPKHAQLYDEALMQEMKAKYPNGLKYKPQPFSAPEGDEVRLDLADLVAADKEAKEKANFFACAICTMIVKDPTECKGCNSLFCVECLAPWTANNEHCPKKCQGNNKVEFGSVHRFAKQELESMKFKCKSQTCESVNKYNEAVAHVRTCPQQMQACPQGCGLGFLGEDLEYHFQMDCPNTKYVCGTCDEEIQLDAKEEHNCIETLKKMLKEQRNENAALKIQVSQGGTGRQAVGNHHHGRGPAGAQIQGICTVNIKCPQGHELTEASHITEYDTVMCDMCHDASLNLHSHFHRCASCQYDVCVDCAQQGNRN